MMTSDYLSPTWIYQTAECHCSVWQRSYNKTLKNLISTHLPTNMAKSSEADFKKIYNQHVQENVDLKKQMRGFEEAKVKRVNELSQSQSDFLKKYNKYINGSLKPNKTSFGSTPTKDPLNPLHGLTLIKRCKTDLGHEPNDIPLVPVSRTPTGKMKLLNKPGNITKNCGMTSPIDFPYSFDTWQTMLDNGCKDPDGSSALDSMREKLVHEETPQMSSETDDKENVSSRSSSSKHSGIIY